MAFVGRARYLVLVTLCLLYFLLMATTFNALGLVLPLMVKDLHWTWAEAGSGFTVLGLVCGLTSMIPALAIRRIGVSMTLMLGAVSLMLGFGTFATTHAVWSYLVGAALVGLGFSICGTVPGVHVISQSFARRSTALGIYFGSGNLGSVAGPMLFFAVNAHASNWRYYWMGAAGLALVLGLFAGLATGRGQAPEAEPAPQSGAIPHRSKAGKAMRTWTFAVVVLAYSVFLLVNTTIHSFAAQHFQETGLSMGLTASLLSVGALIATAGAGLAGILGERISARYLSMLALGGLATGALALSVGSSWASLVVFALGFGLGQGFSYVSTTMLLLEFFDRDSSLELYSVMCMISTSAAVGPVLGGMARDATGNFNAVFITCALISLATGLLVLRLRRPGHGAGEPTQTADDSLALPCT